MFLPTPFRQSFRGPDGVKQVPKKTAKERVPVAFWRQGYLPYFGNQGLFLAYFFMKSKISILRGFPDVGERNGARFWAYFLYSFYPFLERCILLAYHCFLHFLQVLLHDCYIIIITR